MMAEQDSGSGTDGQRVERQSGLSAALAHLAGRAADPKAARTGVARLSKTVAPGELAGFYEESSRAFLAAGQRDLAVRFFGEARKAEPEVTDRAELDRLYGVFKEFGPAGATAPADLHRLVKALSLHLAPVEAYARFRELTDLMLGAGIPPYPKMFADLRRLATAAGVARAAAEQDVAERLLRSGALAGAPGAVWTAAGPALVTAARGDAVLLTALIAAVPDPAADTTEAAADKVRHVWLGLLADAGAGSELTAEWFSGAGARCPAPTLRRLVGQAEARLDPAPEGHRPAGRPYPASWHLAEPGAWRPRTDDDSKNPGRYAAERWRSGTDFAGVAEYAESRGSWFATELSYFVRDLGHYGGVDYPDLLRQVWSAPEPFPRQFAELVAGWRAGVESGALPLMEAALAHLAPLSDAGFAALDEIFLRDWEIPDPVDALVDTLRGGIPAELALPEFGGSFGMKGRETLVQVVQHGDLLSACRPTGHMVVFTPDGEPRRMPAPAQAMPDLTRGLLPGHALVAWYDGASVRLSEYRYRDGWRTYRVDGFVNGYEYSLTLDAATRALGPDTPDTGEVVFPGATRATRVSCADGRLRFHSADGIETAQLPFGAVQSITDGVGIVPPPDWWRHMNPTDEAGSAALRAVDRETAAELADASVLGPRNALRRLESLLPQITSPALRDGVAAEAARAARCRQQIARLRGGGEPSHALLATHEDLPVTASTAFMAAGRALAGAIEGAVPAAGTTPGGRGVATRPVDVIDIPEIPYRAFDLFSRVSYTALRMIWPWQGEYVRRRELEKLRSWANTPFADGSGRWRRLWLAPTTRVELYMEPKGEVWRTPGGALAILEYSRYDKHATAIEYARDGRFGQVELTGWTQLGPALPQGWGTPDQLIRLERLLADRGPAPARASYVTELADRTGMRRSDAAWAIYDWTGGTLAYQRELVGPEIADLFLDPATGDRATPPRFLRTLREHLMPEDPGDLWTTGPAIDQAAEWWRTAP